MAPRVISQDQPNPTAPRGYADIVAFGPNGVMTLRNVTNPKPQVFNAVADFGLNKGGWRTDKHVRLVGDITGDQNADIVGFGETGVVVSINNGNNTFAPGKIVLNDFSYTNGGWRVEKHIRFVADVRSSGRPDIVGFGDAGVLVAQNTGNGNFAPAKLAVSDFGYSAGWRLDRHLRFLAPVVRGNRLEIVGFGENSVYVGLNNGDGTFSTGQAVIKDFCYSTGWRVESHPRFVADLTGDGLVDVLGCGSAGVYVALNNGGGGFGAVKLALNDFGTQQGWKVDQHPRFAADLTGDKRCDIIGFGDAGVYVSLNNGNGTFQPAKLVLSDFGVQQGWSVKKHLRFAVDLTGDGCADILAFGESSVLVSYNDGKGNFGPVRKVVDLFSFNGGEWTLDNSVRFPFNLLVEP
ncbi:lectin 2 [Crepidotus variabilis]|uniref:Lectin 2 n=1 Tax=Crepidotus variabilis TaxID=179855 RepID=A0A9P6E797_9AGAR|nr:lectin 2 [Crepidotus variabilis]